MFIQYGYYLPFTAFQFFIRKYRFILRILKYVSDDQFTAQNTGRLIMAPSRNIFVTPSE